MLAQCKRSWSEIEKHRTPDGGYSVEAGRKTEPSTAASWRWALTRILARPLPAPEKLLACVQSLRCPDGGYANGSEMPIGLTPPSAAAAAISAPTRHTAGPKPARLAVVAFPSARRAFACRPTLPCPTCFPRPRALHALAGMQTDFSGLKELCLDYVDTLWNARGGFHGNWEDDELDCEYTYYGLLAPRPFESLIPLSESRSCYEFCFLHRCSTASHRSASSGRALCARALARRTIQQRASTATAVCALRAFLESSACSAESKRSFQELCDRGLRWLVENQNADGGWGDTTKSFSNISTTALCWAAFAGIDHLHPKTTAACAAWLQRAVASKSADPQRPLDAASLAAAIRASYGKDHTFSVPILTVLALSGRLGSEKQAWKLVPQLPFELAAFPHAWYAKLKLPVVSYALPALIAIGLVRFTLHQQLESAAKISQTHRQSANAARLGGNSAFERRLPRGDSADQFCLRESHPRRMSGARRGRTWSRVPGELDSPRWQLGNRF